MGCEGVWKPCDDPFPIKKRINTELLIDRTAAGWRDLDLRWDQSGDDEPSALADWRINYALR